MSLKVAAILIFIVFISLPSTCQSLEAFQDILNVGYDVLQNLHENKLYVFQRIDNLWAKRISHDPTRLTTKFNLYYYNNIIMELMRLVGVQNDNLYRCLVIIQLNSTINQDCGDATEQNIQRIKDFAFQIETIAIYMNTIEWQFNSLKQFRASSREEKPISPNLTITDNLYSYISRSCQKPGNCFFHRITGMNIKKPGQKRPVSIPHSMSGEIYHAYFMIAVHFLKGYVMEIDDRFGIPVSETAAPRIELIQMKFLMHTHALAQMAHSALTYASRNIIRGEPTTTDLALGTPYIQLNYLFSQVIINEAYMNPDHDCGDTCGDYDDAVFHLSGPYDGNDICNGTLRNCYRQELGWICPSTDSTVRRYNGITSPDRALGNVDDCSESDEMFTNYRFFATTDIFHRCDVCTCICDDHYSPESIRTFSLGEVTSDVEKSMVITGLRLTEINHIIYIQIQEGQMQVMNRVQFPRWAPVKTIDLHDPAVTASDIHILNYEYQNRVNLDTISTQDAFLRSYIANHSQYGHSVDSYVLTGVKFERLQSTLIFGVKLTPWNAKEGQLEMRDTTEWLFNTHYAPREEIRLEHSDLPTKARSSVEVEGNYYVRFQVTDNVKDFGQTTVPFLDAREVVAVPAMPLAGAGLYYKGQPGYGGVIGLKLISIDFSKLIQTEIAEDTSGS